MCLLLLLCGVLMKQSRKGLFVDKGRNFLFFFFCCNVLPRTTCPVHMQNLTSSYTDQHEPAILLRVPSSCDSTSDSLVYMSSELILLKINLTNHMVKSLVICSDSSHHIVE